MRVVGVCDSESLIAVSDVFSMDLDDRFLSEICQVKLNGSSLLTLRSSGNLTIPCIDKDGLQLCMFLILLCLFFAKDERQVHTNPNVTRKVIDIANHLGKSLGMWHL